MFGIGFTEFLLIAVLALIFIGPKQLPEVARSIARFLNEIKRSGESLRNTSMTPPPTIPPPQKNPEENNEPKNV